MTKSQAHAEIAPYVIQTPRTPERHGWGGYGYGYGYDVEWLQLALPGIDQPSGPWEWARAYAASVNWYKSIREIAKHGIGPLPKPSVFRPSHADLIAASKDKSFAKAYRALRASVAA
jgi:hypothetical protein